MSLSENVTSIAKLILHPRSARITPSEEAATGTPLIILGNGPSLNDTLAAHSATLHSMPTLAVNFAANTPVFRDLKPRYYVLADPHFFHNTKDPNVKALIDNLRSVDWPMTLFIPKASNFKPKNELLTVEKFPMTGVEGCARLERMAYRSRKAMPRPRNVLIPSIMIGIWLGFHDIYITGADHSWMSTIRVNEQNEVISEQPHFYKDNEQELNRIRVDYLHLPLHEVVKSFYIAFRAYHQIQRFAKSAKVAIYNSTPGSFIDAFPRKPLPEL